MPELKLYDAEFKFMNILWQHEPVNSTKLAGLCREQLGWKKPTTYTVIRKLAERGLVRNDHATVTALVRREEVQQYEVGALLEKAFGGDLPSFIAAFLKGRALSREEVRELLRMIEEAET